MQQDASSGRTRERWRPIPGYRGWYDASSHGRIRSWVERLRNEAGRLLVTGRRLRVPRVLAGRAKAASYFVVSLGLPGGRRRTLYIHRLVLLAFRGHPPSGCCTRHLDGVRTNNTLPNLRYGTPKENVHDTIRHGHRIDLRGEHHPRHKLTVAGVLAARTAYVQGTPLACLARKYRVDVSTMRSALLGATWKSVPRPAALRRQRKMTQKLIIKLQRLWAAGRSIRWLAERFGWSYTAVWGVVRRRDRVEPSLRRQLERQRRQHLAG